MNKWSLLASTALTGSVLIAAVDPASACLFSQSQGSSPSTTIPTLTNQSSNLDLNTLGIIASGAAALLVLGKLVRAGTAKTEAKPELNQSAIAMPVPAEATTTEVEEEQLTSVG